MSTDSASNRRREARIPALLAVHYRVPGREAFIERYVANVSRAGMFIVSRELHPKDTQVQFELRTMDGELHVAGKGVVRWARPADPMKHLPPGVGVQFTELESGAQEKIDALIARQAAELEKAAAVSEYVMPPAPSPVEAAGRHWVAGQGEAFAQLSRRRQIAWAAAAVAAGALLLGYVVSDLVNRLRPLPPPPPRPVAVAPAPLAEDIQPGTPTDSALAGTTTEAESVHVPAPPAPVAAEPEPPPRPKAKPPPPRPLPVEEIVRSVIQKRAFVIKQCYERLLREQPEIKGRVIVEISADDRGKVEQINVVENTTADRRVATCLREALKGVAFTGITEEMVIQVPFMLTPDRLSDSR
jgi:uncharacterized protein (TIGR02266 family)